jgi:hypothetical protein
MILLAALLVGLLVAWLLGAQLSRLDHLRLRGAPLIFTSLAIELSLFIPGAHLVPGGDVRWLNFASYVFVLGFMVVNVRRAGFALAVAGAVANCLVIIANGGLMPVTASAWSDSGRSMDLFSNGGVFMNNVLANAHTHLVFLADVFAIPRAIPIATPISIGDILIVLGTVVFVYRACTPPLTHSGSHPLAPLRNRQFRHLIIARVTSSAGDWISLTAVVSWIYAQYHSVLVVSVVMISRITASSIGGLIAARGFVWLSRYRVLTLTEIARGLITVMIIPCALAGLPIPVIVLASCSSLLGAGTRPAATSLIPTIVPTEALQAANAIHGVARNVMMVLATFGTALAFIKFGITTALIIDVITFAIAALAYKTYMPAEAPLPPAEEDVPESLVQQVQWIKHNRVCASLVGSFAIATMAIGMFNTALPDFMAHHMRLANGYGLALGFIGIGFTLGEASTAFLHRESVARRSVGLAFIGTAAALLTLSHTETAPAAFMAFVVLGASDGTTEVVFDTLVQRSAPQALQASVFALASTIQNVGMVLGFLLSPIIVAAAGTNGTDTAAAASLILAAAVAMIGLYSTRAASSRSDSLHETLETPHPELERAA